MPRHSSDPTAPSPASPAGFARRNRSPRHRCRRRQGASRCTISTPGTASTGPHRVPPLAIQSQVLRTCSSLRQTLVSAVRLLMSELPRNDSCACQKPDRTVHKNSLLESGRCISGTSSSRWRNVPSATFEGSGTMVKTPHLTFRHADWTLALQGHSDPQAAVCVPASSWRRT